MIKGGRASLYKWVLPVLILLATGIFIYIGFHRRMSPGAGSGDILLELKPVQVKGGWGYLIYTDHKVYIRQTIIPAIPGSYPFRTREDALTIGQKVVDRLRAGQMPLVTSAEVRSWGRYTQIPLPGSRIPLSGNRFIIIYAPGKGSGGFFILHPKPFV